MKWCFIGWGGMLDEFSRLADCKLLTKLCSTNNY